MDDTEWAAPAPRPEEETKTLGEYLAGVRRRKWSLILTAALILALAVGIALGLPPVYRSTGVILIERQEIPQEWVEATVTSFADQRIQTISQRVLTTANLIRVIEKWNIYTEERQRRGTAVIVERMREDFSIDMISAKVRDPRSGQAGVATIAFSVSFEHRHPGVAQKVANDLVSLYLEENIKTRSQAVGDATRFLETEAGKLNDELSELEARIADFKEKNMGRLPEQQDLNLQLMQRAEQALQETQRQIRSMEERKIYLESALAQMQIQLPQDDRGDTGGSSRPATPLDLLRVQYASLSAIYAEDHPDLARLRRQIEAFEQEGSGDEAAAIEITLRALREELSALEERYAEGHPDINRLRDQIAGLENPPGREVNAPRPTVAARPFFIKTQADLNTIDSELKNLRQQAKTFTESVRSIERRIADTPRAEQEYLKLVRDRENLLAKYQDIRAKQSSARVSEALEEGRRGERFALIEPPQFPQAPIKPNRPAILMLGVVASLFGGFGTVVTREISDRSVRTARAVIGATHAPVLAVVPWIETITDRRRTRRNRILILAAVILCIVIAAALVHFYYRPLDMLWYKLVERALGLW
ncbi:MAG: Wzz/FepE/Etk N-terminal domain-containing protein [Gammaproteobacteria bacterium]|nr:Wzz/FepE/Etk N-terminal domain-containing protein [Gammaproteobacteria bacterium]MDH3464607.1 Wzz/FepE/Etk N-terminal domain-containing protein [Gammaproteobacteria bacterium]